MKLVLTRPNYDSHIITPPLGLGYLASYLMKSGIQVSIIDALKNSMSLDALVEQIRREQADAVGITCLTAFYHEVVDLSTRLKRAGQRVIIGGVHPTFLPHQTLKESGCDYIIAGEGESALLSLVRANFGHKGIPGVYTLADLPDASSPSGRAECIEDLDALPFPAWEQMDPRTYPQAPHGTIAKHYPIGVVTTTRGCPYTCTFCASPRLCGRKIRFRSPANVVAEIRYLVERFGVREIHFEDDNLTLRRDHVEGICHGIIESRLNISWACPNGVRADRIDESLLRLMKQSGCYYVAFGIESADPGVLERAKKQERIETIEEAIGIAAKVGVSSQGFFIFGLPGETPATMKRTIDFARRSRLARAQFLILDVLPGSELWYELQGTFSPNWGKKSYKEPEWIPEGVTRDQLLQGQSRAFREFYLKSPLRLLRLACRARPGQVKHLLHRMRDYGILRPRRLK
jgi:anaerobic magnesium-protoporphyrin IX monomethyl ester cyclase